MPVPLRLLLVEDSAEDAELILHQLRHSGFDPVWQRVETEPDYIARLDDPLDLILADYTLPQFSAPRALQLLQERGLGIPFVVVSGTMGEETAVSLMKQGASDYVLKDRLAGLAQAVFRALQGQRKIAYFSMEIALSPEMPTYAGGLGVLAGDTIRSAADLRVPMIVVSLLHRHGHFCQRLDAEGGQTEHPVLWKVEEFLAEMPARAKLSLEGRTVWLRAWKYEVRGAAGYVVPVYLLDTDLAENSEWDRALTNVLYGGDWYYRLCQEAVLGIGGMRMLAALGYNSLERFHLNEGHASLLTLELLQEEAARAGRLRVDTHDLAVARRKCIFTTHTPVPAGHDQFPLGVAARVLGHAPDFSDLFPPEIAARVFEPRKPSSDAGPGMLNMTYLGLNMSRYVNGVAKKHGEVSRLLFAGYQIDAITNGVHVATWTSPPFQALYDRYFPDWRLDNFSLRYAESLPPAEVWEAHRQAKAELLDFVKTSAGASLDPETFTIGFARRATAYKRPDLLLTDVERLKKISARAGKLQVIYAGKAHPGDRDGKLLIQKIFAAKESLKGEIPMVYLPNYDLQLGKRVTAGVDLWLNTPQPPLEASGTSGMKAALNGIPSLSIVDGWWVEGLIEGITGWAIGGTRQEPPAPGRTASDAALLYDKLEQVILPMYYRDRDRFLDIMRHAIALNGSFFNTHRMLQQYVLSAYFR